MRNIILVMALGAALFMGLVWQLGLLETPVGQVRSTPVDQEPEVTAEDKLGDFLYKSQPFVAIPPSTHPMGEPIVLHGVLQAIEQEEVPSQVPGRIWFIGEEVDDAGVVITAHQVTQPRELHRLPDRKTRQDHDHDVHDHRQISELLYGVVMRQIVVTELEAQRRRLFQQAADLLPERFIAAFQLRHRPAYLCQNMRHGAAAVTGRFERHCGRDSFCFSSAALTCCP